MTLGLVLTVISKIRAEYSLKRKCHSDSWKYGVVVSPQLGFQITSFCEVTKRLAYVTLLPKHTRLNAAISAHPNDGLSMQMGGPGTLILVICGHGKLP